MRITELRVNKFGCFDKPRRFLFGNNVNLITAPNGAGKTTTLRLLATILDRGKRLVAVGEADAVHRQLSADRAAGRCPTELHWHVRRDRYRLALQLREVRRDGVPDAPPLADGLSREAAPKAKMVWQPDPADPRPPLEQLSELVLGRVLDDETLATTALTRLAHFNRLCLALAAEEQGPDFFPARRPSPP